MRIIYCFAVLFNSLYASEKHKMINRYKSEMQFVGSAVKLHTHVMRNFNYSVQC